MSFTRQVLAAALHPLQTNTLLEVDWLAMVTRMTKAGLSIRVAPALTLFCFERESLPTRPMPIENLARMIYLVRHQQENLSAAAQALHSLIVLRMKA